MNAMMSADLPVKLAHAPAAAQGFGFVELARVVVLDHQQPHIGRPRQGEDMGQFVQPPRAALRQQEMPLRRR